MLYILIIIMRFTSDDILRYKKGGVLAVGLDSRGPVGWVERLVFNCTVLRRPTLNIIHVEL